MEQQQAAKGRGRMSLGAVIKGRVQAPLRVVLYGTEGVGKSTWAADAPSPIFLPVEEGSNHLDVARFPLATSWGDVLDALVELETGKHDFRTLVIDTLDALEPLVWDRVCVVRTSDSGKKVSSIEDYGFAKGYIYALDIWRELLERIDGLRSKRGMSVVLIAHADLKTIKNPDAEDFQRYDLKLHHKASALVREWSEHVLFAATEVALRKINNRTKIVGLGDRVVHTTSAPGWVAKSRGNVPAMLPLSYESWAEALAGTSMTADAVLARIEAMLPQLAEEKQPAVRALVEKAKAHPDPIAALNTVANRLSVTVNSKEAA
jgi:hypothetical protein